MESVISKNKYIHPYISVVLLSLASLSNCKKQQDGGLKTLTKGGEVSNAIASLILPPQDGIIVPNSVSSTCPTAINKICVRFKNENWAEGNNPQGWDELLDLTRTTIFLGSHKYSPSLVEGQVDDSSANEKMHNIISDYMNNNEKLTIAAEKFIHQGGESGDAMLEFLRAAEQYVYIKSPSQIAGYPPAESLSVIGTAKERTIRIKKHLHGGGFTLTATLKMCPIMSNQFGVFLVCKSTKFHPKPSHSFIVTRRMTLHKSTQDTPLQEFLLELDLRLHAISIDNFL